MLLCLVAACGGAPDVDPTDVEADTDTDTTPTGSETGSHTGTDTTDTGGTTPPDYDCAALPPAPLSITQLPAARGYHDVAFDDVGNIVGSDNSSLLKVGYSGGFSVFVAGSGVVQQMDWLPGGDLVYVDGTGAVIRATPQGASSVLAPGTGVAYGLRVAPDGQVWVANWYAIDRYDPDTGARVRVLDDPRISPYVFDFSPDLTKLYVGTIWHDGTIWSVDLDQTLTPVGSPTPFATVGTADEQLHDALGVDACGNLYVAEFYTSNLYRVSAAGQVTLLLDYTVEAYGHGLEWGSGIGGWRTDALYVPQPYDSNQVTELVIGVPRR